MIKEILQGYSEAVNKEFDRYIPYDDKLLQKDVVEAMRYSLISTGKKIRPALVFEFAKACGCKDLSSVMPFACAVEMVHSYSLIHDDLPCMDDDVLRRGKPSCHVKFGEDIALLAGDGLLSLAFDTMSSADQSLIPTKNIVRAVKELGYCSGAYGMVGGQVIDLQSEGKKTDLETLQAMHKGKTGMMIICAALLGCYGANATDQQIEAAKSYASDIGMVFQIVDDVLDVTGDESTLGKPIGSDNENMKTTYATLYSIEECMKLAFEFNEKAKKKIVECFGPDSKNLCELADMLLNRKN